MAIFKKLNIGDTVATSGTRCFRKLTKDLPIWNGTDLTGTEWYIPAGSTAEAGCGLFDVYGVIKHQPLPSSSKVSRNYTQLLIGYSTRSPYTSYEVAENAYTYLDESMGWYATPDRNESRWLSFTSGTDVTNTRLIDWLLKNGTLTSHRLSIVGTWLINENPALNARFDVGEYWGEQIGTFYTKTSANSAIYSEVPMHRFSVSTLTNDLCITKAVSSGTSQNTCYGKPVSNAPQNYWFTKIVDGQVIWNLVDTNSDDYTKVRTVTFTQETDNQEALIWIYANAIRQ